MRQSYQEACDINQRLTGKRLSVENWNGLFLKFVRSIAYFRTTPQANRSFHQRNPPRTLLYGVWQVVRCNTPKSEVRDCRNGRNSSSQSIRGLPILVNHALSTYRRKDVARDEILDALDAAVTGADGGAKSRVDSAMNRNLMNGAYGWRWYIARPVVKSLYRNEEL